jgi:hypothetical protein
MSRKDQVNVFNWPDRRNLLRLMPEAVRSFDRDEACKMDAGLRDGKKCQPSSELHVSRMEKAREGVVAEFGLLSDRGDKETRTLLDFLQKWPNESIFRLYGSLMPQPSLSILDWCNEAVEGNQRSKTAPNDVHAGCSSVAWQILFICSTSLPVLSP